MGYYLHIPSPSTNVCERGILLFIHRPRAAAARRVQLFQKNRNTNEIKRKAQVFVAALSLGTLPSAPSFLLLWINIFNRHLDS